MVATCSAHNGELTDVQWYVVPGTSQLPYPGDSARGYWSERGNRIVLAESAQLDGPLVRHEMLHALLGVQPSHHPRDQFLGRCSGIVLCAEDCVRDAGTIPGPDAVTEIVPPESLDVTVTAAPAVPSAARYGGHFALIVSVSNPRPRPVVMRFSGASASSRLDIAFGYEIRGGGLFVTYNAPSWDPAPDFFEAGETKRLAFDFLIGRDPALRGGLPTGTFEVVGTFGGHKAGPLTLVVRP